MRRYCKRCNRRPRPIGTYNRRRTNPGGHDYNVLVYECLCGARFTVDVDTCCTSDVMDRNNLDQVVVIQDAVSRFRVRFSTTRIRDRKNREEISEHCYQIRKHAQALRELELKYQGETNGRN